MGVKEQKAEYKKRFEERVDELKWLYCEIYHNDMQGFEWLCDSMYTYYEERAAYLKKLDRAREKDKNWYHSNKLLGMMLYTGAFAKTLKGVREKLGYIESCGVNYVHLMPLLESPKGRDDGGYAVADFRRVQPELGTIEDLRNLTKEMHEKGMSCCMDFVMNHTSEATRRRESATIFMTTGIFRDSLSGRCRRCSRPRRRGTSPGWRTAARWS